MIKRIVRLSIDEKKADEFVSNFNKHKEAIKKFDGCEHLELWQDHDQQNVFVTYSHWTRPEDLEAYRKSDFFADVWSTTKTFFNGKPLAWSHVRVS